MTDARPAQDASGSGADDCADGALAAGFLAASDRGRQTLARSLHGEPAQLLALAQMKLGMLRGDDAEAVDEVALLLRQASVAMQKVEFRLHPPALRDLGIAAAFDWLCGDVLERYGVRIDLIEQGEPPVLDERVAASLYHAVRAAVWNVVSHAGVNSAQLACTTTADAFTVSLSDQGRGFDASQCGRAHGGLGLAEIRTRLHSLGGTAAVHSAPGAGTRVTLCVPLEAARAADGR